VIGVRSWLAVIQVSALALLIGLLSLRIARSPRPTLPQVAGMVVGTSTFAASLGVLYGPFVLPPVVALAVGTYIMIDSRAHPRTRKLVLICSALAVSLPLVAEATGVWPSAVHFSDAAITIDALAIASCGANAARLALRCSLRSCSAVRHRARSPRRRGTDLCPGLAAACRPRGAVGCAASRVGPAIR
jgi:hypothetical protein